MKGSGLGGALLSNFAGGPLLRALPCFSEHCRLDIPVCGCQVG